MLRLWIVAVMSVTVRPFAQDCLLGLLEHLEWHLKGLRLHLAERHLFLNRDVEAFVITQGVYLAESDHLLSPLYTFLENLSPLFRRL